MKKFILIIPAIMLVAAACDASLNQTQPGSESTGSSTTGNVAISPGAINTTSLSTYADLALGSVPTEVLSVKFVTEHRSALNGKTIKVKGIITNKIEGGCESSTGGTGVRPMSCAQSSIFIADSNDSNRDKNYDMSVIVDSSQKYGVGQSVTITGLVFADKIFVYMLKSN